MNTSTNYVDAINKTLANYRQIRKYLDNPMGYYIWNAAKGEASLRIWSARQKCWKKVHMYERQFLTLQRLYIYSQQNNNN